MKIRLGIAFGVLALGSVGHLLARQAQNAPMVYRVPVTGTVELGLAPFIERSINEAYENGAAAVVLDIDTPGGRVDAAERIADAISDSPIPVYAYINRRAFSAGALIALSTNQIFMRSGSVMGAVTPVDGAGTKAPEKIVSAMRSEMRALAEARGLDPAIAEAMVDEQLAVPGVVEAGKLLTLTTTEAVGLSFAQETETLDELFAAVGLAGAQVVEMEVNWAERLVRLLSHPVVSPFLLSLGFLGILVEIKTPSFGVAGLAGLMSLSLFFGSHLIIGLAGWEDVIIFLVGAVLIAVEIVIIPGFGLFGILGGVALLLGAYMAVLGNLPTVPDFTRAGGVLSTTILLLLVTAWALLRHLPKSDRLSRSGVFLSAKTDREGGYESASRRDELVGLEGVAITDLHPSGVGLFGEERVDVVSESDWIAAGSPIRVLSAEGYRHVVRELRQDQIPAQPADEVAE